LVIWLMSYRYLQNRIKIGLQCVQPKICCEFYNEKHKTMIGLVGQMRDNTRSFWRRYSVDGKVTKGKKW